MAVKRVWFINAPSSGIDVLDRSQIAIGYPFNVTSFQILKTALTSYFRRYLNDVVTSTATIPLVLPVSSSVNNSIGGSWEVSKNSVITYVRRYLNDADLIFGVTSGPFDDDIFDF